MRAEGAGSGRLISRCRGGLFARDGRGRKGGVLVRVLMGGWLETSLLASAKWGGIGRRRRRRLELSRPGAQGLPV